MANQIKENEAANISPYYEQAAPASLVSVQGFLSFVRHRWYWYVISVAVCVGIAWLMLARSPRLYTKSETILKSPDFRQQRLFGGPVGSGCDAQIRQSGE